VTDAAADRTTSPPGEDDEIIGIKVSIVKKDKDQEIHACLRAVADQKSRSRGTMMPLSRRNRCAMHIPRCPEPRLAPTRGGVAFVEAGL
jgi:hypothetical protein